MGSKETSLFSGQTPKLIYIWLCHETCGISSTVLPLCRKDVLLVEETLGLQDFLTPYTCIIVGSHEKYSLRIENVLLKQPYGANNNGKRDFS